MDSILDSVKKVCSIDSEYTAFDTDFLMHINSVFSTLNQLGIGPVEGFAIEDASPTWQEYLGDDLRLNDVKSYIYLRVRLLFDPPTTGFLVQSMKEQIQELEWRISVRRENDEWTPGVPASTVEPEVVIIPSSKAYYRE